MIEDYIIKEGDPKEFKKDFREWYHKRITCKAENIIYADELGNKLKKKYGLNESQLSDNFFYHMKTLI